MLSNDLLLRRLKCRSEIFAFLKRGTSELFYPRLESCNVSLSDTCSFIQQIYIDIIINTVTTAVPYMPRQKPLVRKTDNIKGHVFQKKTRNSLSLSDPYFGRKIKSVRLLVNFLFKRSFNFVSRI